METTEDNNVVIKDIEIEEPKENFELKSISWNDPLYQGEETTITVALENSGGKDGNAIVSTYADGNKWDTFSGTSCAAPTVVGKAACMMEEYYTLNGAWPTPTQVKNMLVTEARNGNNRALDPASTTWSNVPTAATTTCQR